MANLTRRREWDPFAGLLADYGFSLPGFEREPEAFVPRFEVKERKEALVLKADVPGVRTEDLDVSVHGNVLTVTGKREQEKTTNEERYHMVERTFGTFTRSFTLPDNVDTKALDAQLKEGVLTVTLPKVPEARPQKVQIKT